MACDSVMIMLRSLSCNIDEECWFIIMLFKCSVATRLISRDYRSLCSISRDHYYRCSARLLNVGSNIIIIILNIFLCNVSIEVFHGPRSVLKVALSR